MLLWLPFLVLLVGGDAVDMKATHQVTPIQKVIQLLGDMLSKGKTEKKKEEADFREFQNFCEQTGFEKKRDIGVSNEAIEQLVADIGKAEADAVALGKEIAELDGSIQGWTLDEENATAIRKKDEADYKVAHQDYTESVDALERAIATLKSREADVPQALISLRNVVVKNSHFPSEAVGAIQSLIQTSSTFSLQAPEANAYEFQSGGVINMLKGLKDKFLKELRALETDEMKQVHNYEMLMQKLHDDTENANEQKEKKTEMKARRQADAARGKGDLTSTTALRDDDDKYLSDLITECKSKSRDFESRQVLRKGEIDAISKAIEIMSSPAVSGAGDKHLPAAFVQARARGTSLVQLRNGYDSSSPLQHVASFLSQRASRSKSGLLTMMANHAANDPFAKVKKMIQDMLVKLMEEANAEADHKAWCDTELATNQQTREQLTASVTDLTAQVDELTAQVSKLGRDISQLSDEIAELDAAVAKATNDRANEKADNAQTLKDAQAAQTAVAQAIQVLKDFYASAAEATALAQSTVAINEPYKGMQDEGGGVLGMLEVIQSDFARLESETTSAEDTGQREFDKFSADSSQDKAVKQTEIDHKTLKKQQSEAKLATANKELEDTNEELTAAMNYYEKLKPSCLDSGMSYADRKQRREEEIDSLKEALNILSGETIA
jgi:chromosome segregation ATPase